MISERWFPRYAEHLKSGKSETKNESFMKVY